MTVWLLRVACLVTKATNTLWEYVILLGFPLQQWLRERALLLLYVYSACRVPHSTALESQLDQAALLVHLTAENEPLHFQICYTHCVQHEVYFIRVCSFLCIRYVSVCPQPYPSAHALPSISCSVLICFSEIGGICWEKAWQTPCSSCVGQ
jgi:hypothetical protein